MATVTYLEAIRQGLSEEMERDERVFLIGEDIGVYGGAFKLTKGLLERFGEGRVIDTPISEAGFVGAAIGAALMGLRPVVEIQYADFITCAYDLIVNYAAKAHYRWGAAIPMVIRGPSGGGVHGGPFHSNNPEVPFIHIPGLKVVVPGTVYDAKGLLKAAIRDPNPVIYFEHKRLYRSLKQEIPEEDYVVPLGKARIARGGSDLTIATYGAMLHIALEASEALAEEEISAEVIDLRTLVPLDEGTLVESVKKTSRLIILHEDTRTGGFAGELTSRIVEKAFDYLDAPIVRLTSPDCPVPFSPPLEEAFLPSAKTVIAAARDLHSY